MTVALAASGALLLAAAWHRHTTRRIRAARRRMGARRGWIR